MTDLQMKLLASYLTNSSRVVTSSILLGIEDNSRVAAAVEFFALRAAFGVNGYMNANEALKAIKVKAG